MTIITNLIELLELKNTSEIIDDVNMKNIDMSNIIKKTITHLKNVSNVDNIGIRIKDELNDYPYFSYIGFTDEFIRLENSLISRSPDGNIIYRDKEKRIPVLDCMCGNVLSGNVLDKHYFTKRGSFWCNDTNSLMDSCTIPCSKDAKIRGTCNQYGYLTVILIPMFINSEIIGLIQINDKKRRDFTESDLEYFESISDILSLSLQNHFLYSKFYKIKDEINALNKRINERRMIENTTLPSKIQS